MYIIRDREYGDVIGTFNTLEEATNALQLYEENIADILKAVYRGTVENYNYYEIIESEDNNVNGKNS